MNHKPCKCGSDECGIAVCEGAMRVECPTCGRASMWATSRDAAWAAWDADHEAVAKAREALRSLVGTIEAHDVRTLDCDRRGVEYCNCLERPMKMAHAALDDIPTTDGSFHEQLVARLRDARLFVGHFVDTVGGASSLAEAIDALLGEDHAA